MRVVWVLVVFILLGALTLLMPGGATREAAAAADVPAVAAPGSGKNGGEEAAAEEAKEEGQKEAGKAEEEKGAECPTTFGPILTDTAVPIDKGKLAIQPTFSLGFLTSIFNRNWHPVSARRQFHLLSGKRPVYLWLDQQHGSVCPHPLRPEMGERRGRAGAPGREVGILRGAGRYRPHREIPPGGGGAQDAHGDGAVRHRFPHRPLQKSQPAVFDN